MQRVFAEIQKCLGIDRGENKLIFDLQKETFLIAALCAFREVSNFLISIQRVGCLFRAGHNSFIVPSHCPVLS